MDGLVEKRRAGTEHEKTIAGNRVIPRTNRGNPTMMVRIQLDLPEEKVEELNSLMSKADIGTRKDLFNNALSLLAWAIKEREGGNIIVSMNEAAGTFKELVMPALETAAKKKRYADQERAPAEVVKKGHSDRG